MIWCNAKCAALEDFLDFAKKPLGNRVITG